MVHLLLLLETNIVFFEFIHVSNFLNHVFGFKLYYTTATELAVRCDIFTNHKGSRKCFLSIYLSFSVSSTICLIDDNQPDSTILSMQLKSNLFPF